MTISEKLLQISLRYPRFWDVAWGDSTNPEQIFDWATNPQLPGFSRHFLWWTLTEFIWWSLPQRIRYLCLNARSSYRTRVLLLCESCEESEVVTAIDGYRYCGYCCQRDPYPWERRDV